MKKIPHKPGEEISPQAPKFVAVLAIVTEMVRRRNENMSKVQLKPLDSALVASSSRQQTEISKA